MLIWKNKLYHRIKTNLEHVYLYGDNYLNFRIFNRFYKEKIKFNLLKSTQKIN